MYLAAAGVGTLGLVDFDAVDESNLQRQIIYGTPDVGRPKLAAAAERLRALNPASISNFTTQPFGAGNARRLVERYDVVIDGTDNFPTRYLVNDACVMTKHAQRLRQRPPVRRAGRGLRDAGWPLLSVSPPGAAAGRADSELRRGRRARRAAGHHRHHAGDGGHQAHYRHRRAARGPVAALRRACACAFRQISLPRDPDCPVCGDAPTIRELVAYDMFAMDPAEEGRERMTRCGRRASTVARRRPGTHAHRRPRTLRTRVTPHRWRNADSAPAVLAGQARARSRRTSLWSCIASPAGAAPAPSAILRCQGYDAHNLSGGIQCLGEPAVASGARVSIERAARRRSGRSAKLVVHPKTLPASAGG